MAKPFVYDLPQRSSLKQPILSELLLFIPPFSLHLSESLFGVHTLDQIVRGPKESEQRDLHGARLLWGGACPPPRTPPPVITSIAIFFSVGWMLLGSV